jgi:RNA polymerase sigma factor FliA
MARVAGRRISSSNARMPRDFLPRLRITRPRAGGLESGPVAEVRDSPEVLERFHGTLELVDIIARQVRRTIGHGLELDELVSFGREGLLDAARRYDPTRGVPFRAYANFRVRGAIIDGVRSIARLPRRAHERLRALDAASRVSEGAAEDVLGSAPRGDAKDAERALDAHLAALATAMAVGLVAESASGEEGEPTPIDRSSSPEDALGDAELLAIVRSAIAELPHEEQELVRRHYLEGERFDRVAADLGLSKSWASRLHTRAVQRLAAKLRGP